MANIILSEEEYNELKKSRDSWRDRYYEVRYALRKDEALDEYFSCVRDIPSDVEMIEDLKKRAADSDYYKEKSELLEERNNNQFNTIREKNNVIDHLTSLSKELDKKNSELKELAESWKKDYEFVRDKLVHPIYDILYPDSPNRDIDVAKFLSNIKDLKVYADENGRMYKEIKEWREKCIARGNEIDHLLSENKELKGRVKYWSNIATNNAGKIIKFKQDMNKWRSLYNSLSETCFSIVTEKDVEIKGLKKDNVYLNQNNALADAIFEKNTKLNQTISDQEITIKALLLTIKEMCKEDETNA